MHTEGGGKREGEEGGTSCTPSKDFEKFGHKNAIKHENRGPPTPRLDFLTTPRTPSKEFENDCTSMIKIPKLFQLYVGTYVIECVYYFEINLNLILSRVI
jgi:hypothetical protein